MRRVMVVMELHIPSHPSELVSDDMTMPTELNPESIRDWLDQVCIDDTPGTVFATADEVDFAQDNEGQTLVYLIGGKLMELTGDADE